ncbi:MAG: WYL domain-containing protein [Aeromicrobium sp.]
MSDSKSQVSRMLALVPYLQGHDGIPVKQVAAEFGVTDKQIRDDLKLLMFCGPGKFPGELIDFDLGALDEDGVIFIRDADFLTRPLKLNRGEAAALIVALHTLRASASGLQSSIIDAALAKMESVVSDDSSIPVDVHVEAVDSAIHATLAGGIADKKRVAITYTTASRDEKSDREIDPRRLFTAQGNVYCEAWCLRAEDIRFFRLDRILRAEVTGVDVEDHEVEPRDLADGLFQVGDDTLYAVLDLQPSAHWLAEYYQVESLGDPVDGVWRVKLFGTDWSWLRRLVLRNSGTVSVVEPATLARDVVDSAVLALSAYDEGV